MTWLGAAALRGAMPLLVFSLSGCTIERGSEVDGGTAIDGGGAHDEDAAPPTLPDAAGERDAGSVADAARDPSDAAAPECTVSIADDFPPLPAACLPRCSAETYACVSACGGSIDCEDECLERDTTPPITIHVDGIARTLACGFTSGGFYCQGWQTTSCVEDVCPDEYAACIRCGDECDRDSPECEAEDSALYDCLIPVLGEVEACMSSRHAECFDL